MLPEILKIIELEGGYVNDPNDQGGETKYGISKKSYPDVDIKALTEQRAYEIYKEDFYDPLQLEKVVEDSVRYKVLEMAVHMGIYQAVCIVQKTLGVFVDGVVGPMTIAALNAVRPTLLMDALTVEQLAFYLDICRRNPSQRKFMYGWVHRAIKTRKEYASSFNLRSV